MKLERYALEDHQAVTTARMQLDGARDDLQAALSARQQVEHTVPRLPPSEGAQRLQAANERVDDARQHLAFAETALMNARAAVRRELLPMARARAFEVAAEIVQALAAVHALNQELAKLGEDFQGQTNALPPALPGVFAEWSEAMRKGAGL